MRGKIIIVEDYADWRDLLGGMLQREGHAVQSAASLNDAREALHRTKDLDLAILDIRLVEIDDTNEDGMQLLAEIRQSHPFTRVIMITGHGNMKTQRKAFREFRAFDFFRKEQFDSEEFRRAVTEAVAEAARDRQHTTDQNYMLSHRFEHWQRQKPNS
jgi:two-component system nitrogen regulation response regulator NtrX